MTPQNKLPVMVCALLLASPVFGEEIPREQMEPLMEECQRQRQEHIAPLREEAIEHCVTDRRQDRETCERRNRNYGERTHGGTQAGLFWQLPACEKAVAAERYFRMNPGRNIFAYEGP